VLQVVATKKNKTTFKGLIMPKYLPGQLIWAMLDDVPSQLRIHSVMENNVYLLQGIYNQYFNENEIHSNKQSLLGQ
jgi:hypothetical protein